VFKAFAEAGEGAREVMALQQVIPLLGEISGASRKLMVQKVSVLPADSGAGGSFAKAAISAMEQLKAATGLDVPAVARRLEGEPPPKRKA
jgi:hypothetical protein